MQFTCELFVHVAEVHILFVAKDKNPYSDHLHLKTYIRAKRVTDAIFELLNPYKHYTRHNSMVSKNRSTIEGSFGSTLLRYTFWSFQFSFGFLLFIFVRIENNSISKYHFGAPGSEEKISSCRHTIHTGIVSVYS
jgi:hypothetical protein